MTNTVALHAKALVRIRTAGSSIVTTPEHPFARPDGAWTPAGELAAGNLIVSASTAGGVQIANVETVPAPPTRVYNLSVAPGRAYFVGVERLLVHNTDCPARRKPVEVNDMPELEGHCALCTVAALADMSVSELEQRRAFNLVTTAYWAHSSAVCWCKWGNRAGCVPYDVGTTRGRSS